MTLNLVLDIDLDIVGTYSHAKNEVNRSNDSKVIVRTVTATDMSETFTFPPFRAVIKGIKPVEKMTYVISKSHVTA